MNIEWIEEQRKKVTANKEVAQANVNACIGALEMLSLMEAELNKHLDASNTTD